MIWRLFVSAMLALLLQGCALFGTQPQNAESESSLPSEWQLQGKLASRGLGAATFSWEQSGADTAIAITAPLGAGAAKIDYVDGQLTVDSSEGRLQHKQAEVWLAHYGLFVPFEALSSWVQGLPSARYAYDATEKGFQQAGWAVSISKWKSHRCVALPNRLRVERGEVLLKLGGLRWQWSNGEQGHGPSFFTQQKAEVCDE